VDKLGGTRSDPLPNPVPGEGAQAGRVSSVSLLVATAAMAATAAAAPGLKPMPDPTRSVNLEALVPSAFGGWRIDPEDVAIPPAPDVKQNLDRLYSQVVSRTYVNAAGERMMLTVAYGGDQSDALKAHRQEVCYSAQGFAIQGARSARIDAAGRSLPVTRFHATRPDRSEPVTYWFTLGDRAVLGRGERLAEQLRHGLRGRLPGVMMVRVSNLSQDVPGAYAAQHAFIAALLASAGAEGATRLAGTAEE
jgi:EpsI family protein